MDKLYGRRWELELTNPMFGTVNIKQEDMETPTLRMSFDVSYPGWKSMYIADIFIWNLKPATLNKIMTGQVEGTKVKLSAGYQSPSTQYGKIFEGFVYQSLFVRENVTDYRLQLRCIDGFEFQMSNWCMFNLKEGYTTQMLANAVAAYSSVPVPIGPLPSDLKERPTPRPYVEFTHPKVIWDLFAKNKNARSFVSEGKMSLVRMTEADDSQPVQIDPSTGLIGTPQQFDYGIVIKCLMNPKIALSKPMKTVQLSSTVFVNMTPVAPGKLNTTPLPMGQAPTSEANKWKDGLYQVGMARYSGDTRGTDWYVEAHCFTKGGVAGLLLVEGKQPNYSIGG